MRGSLGLFVSSADRARLAAIVADRNSPQKHVWRAQVVLLTGDRVGTAEIMRRTDLGKVYQDRMKIYIGGMSIINIPTL